MRGLSMGRRDGPGGVHLVEELERGHVRGVQNDLGVVERSTDVAPRTTDGLEVDGIPGLGGSGRGKVEEGVEVAGRVEG